MTWPPWKRQTDPPVPGRVTVADEERDERRKRSEAERRAIQETLDVVRRELLEIEADLLRES